MKLILFSLVLYMAGFQAGGQTGIPVPEMAQSDVIIKNFLATYDIPGATVAIAKNGKIVYMRAFGYEDVNGTVPTQPYNLFRIASLSKQITSVTIMKLMEEGKLSMSSKVFGPGGILEHHPVFSAAHITDARIYDITVQELLEHSAGWNRDLDCNPDPTTPYPYFLGGCDPISFPLRVSMLTGTSNPVSKEALITFLLEKGLDFTPGTSSNYSNIGFLILGEVIEQLTGQHYEDYVKDSILAPLGIFDMHIGRNLLSGKQEREGEYVGNGYVTLSCYGDGTYVPWEYGGFNVTAMDAHGGWIATSRDMLKLLVAVDGFASKPDILQPSTIAVMTTPSANDPNYAKGWQVNSAHNWWHTGSLDGTASEQVRTSGGYSWIIILNKRNIDNANFWTDLDNLGWNCLAATTSWPTWDLMASPTVNASGITLSKVTSGSVTVSWTNGNGGSRLLLAREDGTAEGFPLDGTDYTGNAAYGVGAQTGAHNYVLYNGTGNSVTVTGLTPGVNYYFRVVEYNKNPVTGNNALYLLGNNPVTSIVLAGSLPVSLSSFKAFKIAQSKVGLEWKTLQESNSSFFEVQRSTDGTHFSAIGSVAAHGNSQEPLKYTFTDDEAPSGIIFYRLKQVDRDGDFTFSKVIALDLPVSQGHFRIVTYADKKYITVVKKDEASVMNAFVSVRNTRGQTLVSQVLSGAASQTVNLPFLSDGIYFVTIFDGSISSTQKILIH